MTQFQEIAKKMLEGKMIFQNQKKIREYNLNSDLAFQKFAKKIANDSDCYFELVNNGVYELRPKWYPK